MSEEIMNKKGFTLMELLTVVIMIGILTAVALPQYRKVVEKGRFTKAQVMAKSMYDSCQRLIAEWGEEDYASLPASVRKISRLDIGSTDLLPSGFVLNDSSNLISGAGFQYTLSGNCIINIKKTEGNYSGVTMDYSGVQFYYCNDNGNGACDIYGID